PPDGARTLNTGFTDRSRSGTSPDARSAVPTRSSPTTFHRPRRDISRRASYPASGRIRFPAIPVAAMLHNRPRRRRGPNYFMWPEGAANRMTEDTASAASPQSQRALHPQQQEMPLAVVHGQAVLQIP